MFHLKTYEEALLTEGSTDILYHFTDFSGALGILESNEMLLASPENNTERAINRGYDYQMSMTTSSSIQYGYPRYKSSAGRSSAYRFMLDARKLQFNYKISRVDYYQNYSRPRKPVFDETEERLLTNKPQIKDIISYIRKLDVYLPVIITHFEINHLRKMKSIVDEKNIPFKIYDNPFYFDRSAEKYALNLEEYLEKYDSP